MLVAAGASAHGLGGEHPSPGGKCRLDLVAEPHTITSGEKVEVFGQLVCLNGQDEGQTVTIYGRPAPVPGLGKIVGSKTGTVLGTATTGAGGFYSFTDPSVIDDTTFFARALAARSDERSVRLEPVVTIKGPSEAAPLFTGARNGVVFSGQVSPNDEGAELVLQRENATSIEEWHVIQTGVVGAGGLYSIRHNFAVPGDANLRIVIRKHGRFTVRGISPTLSYGISQDRAPRSHDQHVVLHDPLRLPVTLRGKLAAGSGKPLTLEGQTSGKVLTTIATATSGSGGEYSFVVTPKQSTRYKVLSSSANSAVLFEGVKYLLTAAESANTVQVDQPITFAGTVTPAVVGKVVYLERENRTGGGFHVVDTGLVQPGGTYSIVDYLFGAGTDVFRVRVPGCTRTTRRPRARRCPPVTVTPAPRAR